jgi:hypothetical protein
MDVLDLFFKKYSYKFEKGYPDLNNKQDILLLESILKDIGIKVKLNEGLTASELQKRENRIPTFINKFFNNSPFELETGNTIVIDTVTIDGVNFTQDSDQENLEQALNKAKKITITGNSDGNTITIPSGKLKKSAEFGGGKGSGAGSANTALAESAQAIVNAIRYNVVGKTLTEEDLTTENYNKSQASSDTTSTIDEVELFLQSNPDWMKSSILTANALASSYPGNFEFS